VDLRFFLRLAGCLFFADCFFSNFMALLLFQFVAKQDLGVFLCKYSHFELVFQICLPVFTFGLPAGFVF